MRSLAIAGAVLVAATGVAGSAGAAADATDAVSLVVAQVRDRNTGLQSWRFSGAISSGAAGEDVTVLQQVCGYPAPGTSVAGTQTRAGGTWDADPVVPALISRSATFRARWRNETSTPVTLKPQIPVYIVAIGRGRLLFTVGLGSVNQNVFGETVLLERFRNKTWTVVQRRKLGSSGGAPGDYSTRFQVRRGWIVRARVPRAVANPCYKPNATERVRVR
jgi:hypothetical protein